MNVCVFQRTYSNQFNIDLYALTFIRREHSLDKMAYVSKILKFFFLIKNYFDSNDTMAHYFIEQSDFRISLLMNLFRWL